MNTRLFRAIIAALLVVFLTLLFDYCRYAVEHHPHFDFTRVIYLGIQGAVISWSHSTRGPDALVILTLSVVPASVPLTSGKVLGSESVGCIA